MSIYLLRTYNVIMPLSTTIVISYHIKFLSFDYYVGGEGLPLRRPPKEAHWPRKHRILALLGTESDQYTEEHV